MIMGCPSPNLKTVTRISRPGFVKAISSILGSDVRVWSYDQESHFYQSKRSDPLLQLSLMYVQRTFTQPLGRNGDAGRRLADARQPRHKPSNTVYLQAFPCRVRDASGRRDNSGCNLKAAVSDVARRAGLHGRASLADKSEPSAPLLHSAKDFGTTFGEQ